MTDKPKANPDNIREAGHYEKPEIDGPSGWWKVKQFAKGKTKAGKVFWAVASTAASITGYGAVANIIQPQGDHMDIVNQIISGAGGLLTAHNLLLAFIWLLGMLAGFITGGRKVWLHVKPVLAKIAEASDKKSDQGQKITKAELERIVDEAIAQARAIWNEWGKTWFMRLIGVKDQRQIQD